MSFPRCARLAAPPVTDFGAEFADESRFPLLAPNTSLDVDVWPATQVPAYYLVSKAAVNTVRQMRSLPCRNITACTQHRDALKQCLRPPSSNACACRQATRAHACLVCLFVPRSSHTEATDVFISRISHKLMHPMGCEEPSVAPRSPRV